MADVTLAALCCQVRDPCEIACLLETAYTTRLLGEAVVSHQIGVEKYTVDLPSLDVLMAAKVRYEQLCAAKGGYVPNASRRPRLCIEFGDHHCGPANAHGCGDTIVGGCQ